MARRPLRASDPDTTTATDLFKAIGGLAKCRELSTAFYSGVGKDPTLRPMLPGKTHRCAINAFAAFLAQFLCGPSSDAQRGWSLSLRESHLRFQIGRKEREAWMEIMARTLRDADLSEPMPSALEELFEEASAYLVNTGPAVEATKHRSEPSALQAQLRRRWELQRALDEAAAHVREGELTRVTAIVEGSLLRSCFERSRSLFAQFVGVLIGSGHAVMAEYAQRTLVENPDLAHESYNGRTLLHEASAAGHLPMVESLLKLVKTPVRNSEPYFKLIPSSKTLRTASAMSCSAAASCSNASIARPAS